MLAVVYLVVVSVWAIAIVYLLIKHKKSVYVSVLVGAGVFCSLFFRIGLDSDSVL